MRAPAEGEPAPMTETATTTPRLKSADVSEAEAFLHALHGDAGYVLCTILPHGQGSKVETRFMALGFSLTEALFKLTKAQRDRGGCGVYFSVSQFKMRPKARGTEAEAEAVPCAWADVDGKTKGSYTPEAKAEALMRIRAFSPSPSIIVDSGGGFYPLFLLTKTIKATPENRERIRAINRALARLLGGDAVGDLARLLRLTGTYNTKPEHVGGGSPPRCTIIEPATIGGLGSVHRYELDELEKLVTDADRQRGSATAPMQTDGLPTLMDRVRRATAYLTKIDGAVSGNHGHQKTWDAALAIVRGFALPPDAALELLMREYNPRCEPPWAERELRHKVKGAADSARVEWGYLLDSHETKVTPATEKTTAKGDPPPEAKTTAQWQAFPLEILPEPIRQLSESGAESIGCDPSFIALPALAAAGAAIGNSRRILVKRGWEEPAVVWVATIGRSGVARKSPTLDLALAPLRDADADAMRKYQRDMENWRCDYRAWEREATAFKRDKDMEAADPGDPPAQPACGRHVVQDVTLEAVATILQENPRGIILGRDELAAWLRSFNQYRARGGGDVQAWLEAHRAGRISIDRKTGVRHIQVAHGFVAVAGTVQPGTLAACLTPEYREVGLAARLLLAFPPVHPRRWTDAELNPSVRNTYSDMISSLLHVEMDSDSHGEPAPQLVSLSAAAKRLFAPFYNELGILTWNAGDDEAAAMAKIEGYAARFALIFTLCDDPDALEVGEDEMRRAIVLAKWLTDETSRVYLLLGEPPVEAARRRLADWIRSRGGTVTLRDVHHNLNRFKTAEEVRDALADLEAHGLGTLHRTEPGREGGRPSDVFILTPAPTEPPLSPPPTPTIPTKPTENSECEPDSGGAKTTGEVSSVSVDKTEPPDVRESKSKTQF